MSDPLTLVFASTEREARKWFRCSGADSARCVVVAHPYQLSLAGVHVELPNGEADYFGADEFSEVVEVGPRRWWTWSPDKREAFTSLKNEIEQEGADASRRD